ncbi:MAG: radical SAM/SPASM domain-containing protein [Spirochaetes bacterium]|nr:MAG: radical SAM/SPASM domain-containing protein [Spirochaetota bacterium]
MFGYLNGEPNLTHPLDIHTIFIELTNKCNFRCNFCPIDRTNRAPGEMDFTLFKRVIDEIADTRISGRIAFHLLGEPLMAENIYRAIEYVKSRGLEAALCTNGSLLTPDVTRQIINAHPDTLSISLETTDAGEHSSRGSVVKFEDYYAAILDALALMHGNARFPVTLTLMNTSSRKFFDLDGTIGVNVRETRFREKLVSLAGDVRRTLHEEHDAGRVDRLLRKLYLNRSRNLWINDRIKIYIQLIADWGNAFTAKKIHPVRIGCCGYTLNRIGVLQDGRVTLCCVDYDGKTSIGNVNDSPLNEILRSNLAHEIREGYKRNRVVHPHCRVCMGDPSRVKAAIKGLLSIYLFKLRAHPLDAADVRLW